VISFIKIRVSIIFIKISSFAQSGLSAYEISRMHATYKET